MKGVNISKETTNLCPAPCLPTIFYLPLLLFLGHRTSYFARIKLLGQRGDARQDLMETAEICLQLTPADTLPAAMGGLA